MIYFLDSTNRDDYMEFHQTPCGYLGEEEEITIHSILKLIFKSQLNLLVPCIVTKHTFIPGRVQSQADGTPRKMVYWKVSPSMAGGRNERVLKAPSNTADSAFLKHLYCVVSWTDFISDFPEQYWFQVQLKLQNLPSVHHQFSGQSSLSSCSCRLSRVHSLSN